MARWTSGIGASVVTSLSFDRASNAVWLGGDDGGLWSLRLLGRRARRHGGGWSEVRAVVAAADGMRLVVARADGRILWVGRDDGDADRAQPLVDLGAALVTAAGSADGWLVALTASGDLVAIDDATGELSPLAAVPAGATHLAIDDAAGEALVTIAAEPPRLLRYSLATGDPVGDPHALSEPAVALTSHPGGAGALVAGASGSLFAVRWSGTDAHTVSIPGMTALARWHSLIFAARSTAIELVEWGDDVALLPIDASPDPLAPGGWAPMVVDYGTAGLAPDEVAWRLTEGPDAGTVSVARPADAGRDRYQHRVLAGSGSAELTVEAVEASSGAVIASRRFRTAEPWPDTEVGPPLAITGPQRVYAKWGGGSPGPENIRAHPAPEEIRMAVALFRAKGSSSQVDAGAVAERFRADILGSGLSVKTYYEEVSARTTAASADPADPKGSTVTLLGGRAFGPIDLPWSWGELFAPANRSDPWAAWHPMGGTWDLLGGAFAAHLADLGLADTVARLADSVVLAMLPGTDAPYRVGTDEWSAQWCWAFAGDAQMFSKTEFSTTFFRRPATVMPAAFPLGHPGPWSAQGWVSTLCHELGHNLGCPDLYNGGAFAAELDPRIVGGWDLMEDDAPLPHYSLPHRMRLGWINPAWIEVCDFAANPSGRTVTLQSIETVGRRGPAAGRRAGVEVRIRPGWNYYFEYRRRQGGQIGDQQMPATQAVLGTDVQTTGADEVLRPLILKLPADADGDGPVLQTGGQDYEESDVTNPDRMNDFRLTRLAAPFFGGDANAVSLEIEYVGAHRAELQIRPAPGGGNFKSPDIDLDGPAGPNVAVKGRTNTLRIRVRNAGTKGAKDVNVRLQWLPFTTSAGPWTALPGPPRQTIPPHQTREFVVPWALPASVRIGDREAEHFCIRADVDRYIDPLDPAGSEIVVHNNWAQSNFTTAAVATGSPSERRSAPVIAHNLLSVPAIHRAVLEQSGDHFRAYVDPAWQALAPGATGVTMLDYESLAGDPLFGEAFERAFRQSGGELTTSDLSLRGFFHAPQVSDGPIERFGVQLLVRAGLRTFIRAAEARGEAVIGEVAAGWPDLPQPVDGGTVRVVGWLAERPDEQSWRDSEVRPDGSFVGIFSDRLLTVLHEGRARVAVYYLGTSRFSPCHSEDLEVLSG